MSAALSSATGGLHATRGHRKPVVQPNVVQRASKAGESAGLVEHEREYYALWKKWQLQIVAAVCVVLWLLIGTIFHTNVNGWTTAQGFYFASQSGFSVGFGAAGVNCGDSDDPNACRWYSIFHILLGSSLISTAFGMFLSLVVNEAEKKSDLAKHDAQDKLLHGKRVEVPKSEFRKLYDVFIENGGIRALKMFFVFFVMIAIGTIYGLTHERRDDLGEEKWDFVRALLFAVSALSTGGLEAPSTDDTGMWFTGWYCLIGCPIYGLLLANASAVLASKQAANERELAMHNFTEDDKVKLDKIDNRGGKKGDGKYQWGEFLELYLVKLGHMTEDDIAELRNKFEEIDVDGNGDISQSEILAELELSKVDTENDRVIEQKEFFALCHNLARKYADVYPGLVADVATEDKMKAAFFRASKNKTTLNRKEVLKFIDQYSKPVSTAPDDGKVRVVVDAPVKTLAGAQHIMVSHI
jgi:hypothetical protein